MPNADKLLEYMFMINMKFSIENLISLSNKKIFETEIPAGHISVKKILVSPTAIIFLPHEIDLGNRVVRDIDTDYLLRVNFVDEYNDRNI